MNQSVRRSVLMIAYGCIVAVLFFAGWSVWRNHRTRIAIDAAELKAASQKNNSTATDARTSDQIDQPDELDGLLATWTDEVFQAAATDESLKKIISKYPLVVLHSRHLFWSITKGRYRQSAFSFNYGTWEESKHGNDVQLQFDNGGDPSRFQVNMHGGQSNMIRDLGLADFEEDFDPTKPDTDDPVWGASCKAVAGHVYHLRVRDDAGNRFHVVFKVVAVDAESKYVAFCWRTLPGATRPVAWV